MNHLTLNCVHSLKEKTLEVEPEEPYRDISFLFARYRAKGSDYGVFMSHITPSTITGNQQIIFNNTNNVISEGKKYSNTAH